MKIFRAYLLVVLLSLLSYTAFVGVNHGWNLLPVFFADIARAGWPGQFNYDFMLMLTLSAAWTMWRNRFSTKGLALGVLALFGGSLFLSVYLLFLSVKHQGQMRAVLLGEQA